MRTRSRYLAVSALAVVALAGCDDSHAASVARPDHVCAGTHGPPPSPSLTFTAEGHPGNTWTLPVRRGGARVRFAISQREGTKVASLHFALAPVDARYPGGEVRNFPRAGADWAPGEHIGTVTWDGRNDKGRPVAPGRYRLYATAIMNTSRAVTCADGTGKGIEVHTGTQEGSGLGLFRVAR
jgi:hypothetical protein